MPTLAIKWFLSHLKSFMRGSTGSPKGHTGQKILPTLRRFKSAQSKKPTALASFKVVERIPIVESSAIADCIPLIKCVYPSKERLHKAASTLLTFTKSDFKQLPSTNAEKAVRQNKQGWGIQAGHVKEYVGPRT